MKAASYHLPAIVQWLQATSLLLLAIAGVFIAGQQAKTARIKLQHDLFDRRYKTFEYVNTFVGRIIAQDDLKLSEMFEFHRNMSDTKFFFDENVVSYINQVKRMAEAFRAARSLNFPNQTEDRRLRAVDEAERCLQWFLEQVEIVHEIFKKSMFIPTVKPFGTTMGTVLKSIRSIRYRRKRLG